MKLRKRLTKGSTLASSAKSFRRVLYLALGVIISSYTVLFILVISKHLDQTAEDELQRLSAAGETDLSRSMSSLNFFASASMNNFDDIKPFINHYNNGLGFEKFQEKWAAIERVMRLADNESPTPRRRVQLCNIPRFIVPPGPMTALASFPGSGNTWLRYLVQQSTGLLTGSIYKDYSLKRNGFPAENVDNGSVLLIKTHKWGEKERRRFKRSVLLLRDPYEALLAEFHRRAGGHVGHASPEKFHKGNAWKQFATTHARLWMEHTLDWLLFHGPLLVIKYELLLKDLPNQLLRLLKFLDMSEFLTFRTFQCVIRNKDGIFRRAKRPLQFDPFDASTRKTVDEYKAVIDTAVSLQENGVKFSVRNNSIIIIEDMNFKYNYTNNNIQKFIERKPLNQSNINLTSNQKTS